jgi:hypothetical protein
MMAVGTAVYGQQSVGGVSDSEGTAANIGNLPNLLKGVNFNQDLGAQVPLDTKFVDSSGNPVTLGEYFGKKAGGADHGVLQVPAALPGSAARRGGVL